MIIPLKTTIAFNGVDGQSFADILSHDVTDDKDSRAQEKIFMSP